MKEIIKFKAIELESGLKFHWDNSYNFKKLKGDIEKIKTEIDIATVEDIERSISVYLSRDYSSPDYFNLTYSIHDKTDFYSEWENVSFEDIQVKDIKSEEELISNMVQGLNKFYISQENKNKTNNEPKTLAEAEIIKRGKDTITYKIPPEGLRIPVADYLNSVSVESPEQDHELEKD